MGLLDLTKIKQIDTVTVDGIDYPIQSSFRYGLMFYRLMSEKKYISEFMFLYKFDKPSDSVKAFNALYDFYCKKTELPRDTGGESGGKILDYDIDSDLIYSAFMLCYGINLITAEMHWYEFRALLGGIKNCKLTDIIEYRSYDQYDKTKYETQMQNNKNAWEIVTPLTEEEKKELDSFESLF